MAWQVKLSPQAARSLLKLEQEQAKRIVQKIRDAAANPQHYFERLTGTQTYKLRIGDYRVISTMLHSEETIYVEEIGHRKNIYK